MRSAASVVAAGSHGQGADALDGAVVGAQGGALVGEEMALPRASVEQVDFAPIVRLDAARREIELCATSEAVDSYGTIFDYAASKDAFTRWMGNVREMHERKAVGQRVGVHFDDGAKKVFVTIRISRGAQDTWEKVVDGTLRGASIGASNVRWQTKLREKLGKILMKATEKARPPLRHSKSKAAQAEYRRISPLH